MNISNKFIFLLLLFSILTPGCLGLLNEEKQEAPNAIIESQYHPSNETLTITHGGGTHFVDENTNRVFVVRERNGEREEVGEIGMPFKPGDSMTVPAQPGDTIIVRSDAKGHPPYNVETIEVMANSTR